MCYALPGAHTGRVLMCACTPTLRPIWGPLPRFRHIDLENKVYPHTFANSLRIGKGYHTALFGKCMNGGCNNPGSMNGAFERWFEGTSYQGGTYFDNESPGNKSVVPAFWFF